MTDNKLLSTKVLEDILKETLGALEEGRSQIYEVAEAAREERDRTEEILKDVRLETHQAILTVEQLEKEFAQIRVRLYTVNKDFKNYGEETKKSVYDKATELRERLIVAKERESMLRIRRDNLEQTFAKLEEITTKAEHLVSQVGVALNYLSGSIQEVNDQIEQLQVREHLGQEILKAQEMERKRMAGALHDGPVQDVANLVIQLEICERLYLEGQQAEAFDSFSAVKEIARACMGEMRRIVYDLNPMTLEDLGLIPTVKNLLDNMKYHSKLETEFHLIGDAVRLDPQIEVNLFRIIQEALNNSRKHARAQSVRVVIEFMPQQINVEIKDDGIGFDPAEIEKKLKGGGHYGLLGLQNRTKMLNGALSIISKVGQGTKILVKVPLNAQ